MLEFLRKRMAALLEARGALVDKLDGTLAEARKESRDLNDTEVAANTEARAALAEHDKSIVELRAQIEAAEAEEKRAAEVAAIAVEYGETGQKREQQRGPAVIGYEPGVYARGSQHSYFRDLALASVNPSESGASVKRLQQNDKEVRVDLAERAAKEKRALTTTDGAGGEFVPPLWLIDEYVALARAGRVVADQLNKKPLPAGTDSINLPKVATGTATAEQATQNTNVQDTDLTTTSVEAKVATIAGKQIVPLQLLEQSPLGSLLDEVILGDLAADYAIRADVFVISNNATGKKGLLNVTGLNAVTYTDGTPTVQELHPKLADAVQRIHTGRFLPAQKQFMHPTRWAWMTAALDNNGRPLVTPVANMPQNVLAAMAPLIAEGFVGMSAQGLPIFVDPNIPTNLGAGTNEDRIIIARTDDILFMEGSPRAEAFRETKAEQLSVLLRLYNYVALHSERYPKSISVISGTGLTTPTF